MTDDEQLKEYISNVLTQVKGQCNTLKSLSFHSQNSDRHIPDQSLPSSREERLWVDLALFNFKHHTFHLDWLFDKTVKKLVIVIINIDTHEPLERWQFDVECDKDTTETR